MFRIANAIQILVVIVGPILLARAIVRRWARTKEGHLPVRWASVGVGAAAFVASQIVHIPFNMAVLPLLPGAGSPLELPILAVFLGLSAGVCEECARYVALLWVRPKDRSGPHALAFGAGHGGIESIVLVGIPALLLLFNLLFIAQVGLENLGLERAELDAARSQLAMLESIGPGGPLLAALERVLSVAFHVSATCLVMRAVVERKPSFLVLAIAWHAVVDAGVVAVIRIWGPIASEAFLVALTPIGAYIIVSSLRALPKVPRRPREDRPETSGAPIELVHASKTFGEGEGAVRALDGLAFTLREGERCCLLGPNGAGKTTAIRLVTGALAPTAGFAFVYGTSSEDEAFLEQKRRIGIVPQQPGMYPELTVRAYLDLVRRLYGASDVDESSISRLGLSDVMDRRTTELSGGMQRRLVLAAALLPRPELLVLDEPSAGLDPVAAREMIECVREASAGRTTLLCTHNLAEAEELCESVIILRGGKAVVHSRIAELRAGVRPRVALKARDLDALAAALAERGHTVEHPEEDGELRVPLDEPEEHAPGLLRELLLGGIEVFECRVVRPSLEEIFFRVVDHPADERLSSPSAVRESAPEEELAP